MIRKILNNKNVRLILKPLLDVRDQMVLFRNFGLPNLTAIRNKNVIFNKPITVNQKMFISSSGRVNINSHCMFGFKAGGFFRGGSIELQCRNKNAIITIGKNVLTNNNIFICSANFIKIGDNSLIGQYVTIMDHEAHGIQPAKRRKLGEIGKIIIGKNVWIGNNVIILKNTTIGDNSIVAAGAVVSGNFPENVIIGGVPAKVIKQIEGI